MTTYFSIDGKIIDPNASINHLVNDRGLTYGHGLFETILYRYGEFPLIKWHLQRISGDAQKLGISIQSQQIEDYLNLFLGRLQHNKITEGVVKVIVTAGVGGRGYAAPDSITPSVICTYASLPENIKGPSQEGIAVRCCEHRLPINRPLAGIKHLNRLDQIIARGEWNNSNYDEGLLSTVDDQLIEGISANLFLKDAMGNWLTPDLTLVGVCGVMRSVLLEKLFSNSHITIKVAEIDVKQLHSCKEMFVCNSIRGIVPVNSIYTSDNQLLNALPLGEQTLMLKTQLTKMYPHYQ